MREKCMFAPICADCLTSLVSSSPRSMVSKQNKQSLYQPLSSPRFLPTCAVHLPSDPASHLMLIDLPLALFYINSTTLGH